jgi:UDP:flavonoid glycosyltransferase YjiC (YdhE family)
LGVARSISRKRYTIKRVTKELQILLSDPHCKARAAEVGLQLQAEDGVRTACDAIEGFLCKAR